MMTTETKAAISALAQTIELITRRQMERDLEQQIREMERMTKILETVTRIQAR